MSGNGMIFTRPGAGGVLRFGTTYDDDTDNGIFIGYSYPPASLTFAFHYAPPTAALTPRMFRSFIDCNETQNGVVVSGKSLSLAAVDTPASAIDELPIFALQQPD